MCIKLKQPHPQIKLTNAGLMFLVSFGFFQKLGTRDPPIQFDGFIDIGKELSLLHTLLVESLDKMNEVG